MSHLLGSVQTQIHLHLSLPKLQVSSSTLGGGEVGDAIKCNIRAPKIRTHMHIKPNNKTERLPVFVYYCIH